MTKYHIISPRDWAVLGPLIDSLCDLGEGSTVTICHDNPDLGGPNCCVYVANASTSYVEKSYRNETVEACLRDALQDYGIWELVDQTPAPSFMEFSLI